MPITSRRDPLRLARLTSCWSAAVLAVSILGCVPSHGAEKVKVTYPTKTASFIFFFTAIDKGFYKKEGLDLEVIEAGGGISTPALISGNVQFSTSGSSAISGIMKGAHLKVLLVGEDRPSWQLWTTHPEIKTFDDLKGKQVGIVSRGDTGEVAIRYYLKKRGLPNNYVAFTPMGSAVASRMAIVRSGSLPAAVLQPAEVDALRSSGGFEKGHLIVDFAKEVRSTFNGHATSDAMIKDHPDTVLKFVRATRKGMIVARDRRDQAIDVFVRVMKATPGGAALGYDELRKVMAEDGTITPESQKAEIELRGDMLGMPASKIPPASAVFDFSWANRINAELKASGWKPKP